MSKEFKYFKLTPFKWFILENFPFIEADFDALTNYELFCKIGKEMNKIIEATNLSGEQVEALTELVNNFINSIDIQEEVNNKLDEMAQDGTLNEIINNKIFSELNSKTKNILEINQASILPSLYCEFLLPDEYSNYISMQSGCVTDNYIILSCTPQDENTQNTLIVVIDKATMKIVNYINSYNFHHAESICFANGYIYILDYLERKIYSFLEGQLLNSTIEFANIINYTENFRAICFDYDNNIFYGAHNNILYKLNNQFEVIERYIINKTENDISVTQGISYIDGKIIFAKINSPTNGFTSYYINKTIITDLVGNILLTYEQPINNQGELEFSSYYINGLVLEGKWLKFSNENLNIQLYLTNYFKNSNSNKYTDFERKFLSGNNINSNTTYEIYCDKTNDNLIVDGTANNPFHSLAFLINYIMAFSTNSAFKINIKGDYSGQNITINSNKRQIILSNIDENIPILGTLYLYNNNFQIENTKLTRINSYNTNLLLTNNEITNPNSSAIFLDNTVLTIGATKNNIHDSINGINATRNSKIICTNNKIVDNTINNTNDVALTNSEMQILASQLININADRYSKIEGILYLPASADLNNYKFDGILTTNAITPSTNINNILNKPTEITNQHFYITNKYVGNLFMEQTLTTYNTNKIYKRTYGISNNTWSAWVAIN